MLRSRRSRVGLELERLEERCTPAISFNGGAVVAHVKVEPLYFGTWWTTSDGQAEVTQINGFLSSIVNSSFMDEMSEYGVGRGTFNGPGIVDAGLLGSVSVSDATIQVEISNDITAGRLPGASINTLYIVFTPPNVIVTSGVESSLKDFFSYHDIFTYAGASTVNYAVVANPVGNGTDGSLDVLQTLTHSTAHELAEAVTDPDGNGWVDAVTGDEICDVVDQPGEIAFLNSYVIPAVWSVKQQSAVYPPDSTPPDYSPSEDQILAANILAPVAYQFATSSEYFDGIVNSYYQDFLGRSAGPSEQSYWAGAMAGGTRDEAVLAQIVASDEYFKHAGGTNQAWIDSIYKDLLNRPADSGGQASWLHSLSTGATREQVAYQIDMSAERQGEVVATYYQYYLGRTASNAEISNWVGLLESGWSQEAVVTSFMASAEFLEGQGTQDQGVTLSGWLTGVYELALNRDPDNTGFNTWIRVLNGPFAS
jgi:Domain of unknown function (DUF4214)